ncbi:type III secretion system cytoplasmic ring protein SctQ [Uliginosibacterium gangwonense]|uniref:type III secretion system cytoplasmic ring protein SctQ n=1 Tax=Uliginosibacterium gangwonense TaxID=392736 RepID=UPI000371CF87|nr:type III secretion system cytoplasmic ring protein SctQ [Uliginosibacterium gangwonense]
MHNEAVAISELSGKLPCIPAAAARLTRILFTTQASSLAHSVGINIAPISFPHKSPHTHIVAIQVGTERARVSLSAQSAPALAIAVSTTDGTLRHALANLVMDASLATLARLLGEPVEFLAFSTVSTDKKKPIGTANHGVVVTLHNITDNTSHELTIYADSDFRSFEHRMATSSPSMTHELSLLKMPARVVLGSRQYQAQFLQSLQPGDVLLNCINGHGNTPDELTDVGIFWGAPHGRQIQTHGHLHNSSITIKKVVTMTADSPHYQPGQNSLPQIFIEGMQDLELPVQLELDSLAMPLGKLCNIQSGHVLELPVPISDTQIRLVSYGQVLGFGQLVAVGENLGLQIIKMIGPGLGTKIQPDQSTPNTSNAFSDYSNESHA